MGILGDGWLWWAVSLAVGVPVLLVVLTELIGWLRKRDHPAVGPLRLLRNWVVPFGSLLALCAFAFQSPADQVWTRVVATVVGFLVILLLLSAFNVALFSQAKQGSWRERVPNIFIEIARVILVVLGLALLFQFVWNADVGGLFAALGVGSIVIGLALQNAIGGVVSGLLLLFEQPFKLGDWLDVGGVQGRVVQVNWRSVHIDTGSGEQIIPNSSLSGASFTNKSKPAGRPYAASADVTFSTDDPPHEVIRLLEDVARGLTTLAPGTQPSARFTGAGSYSVSLPVPSPALAGGTVSTFLGWLWYAARRRGFALDGDATDPIAEPERLAAALDQVGPTLRIGADDRALVLERGRLVRYGSGEVVLQAGTVPSVLHWLVEGRLALAVDAAGARSPFATVERGDYVGQSGLVRQAAPVSAIADTVVTVLELPLEVVDELMRRKPALARDVGRIIEQRRSAGIEAIASVRALDGGR